MGITTREAIRRICELHMIGKVEANRVLTAGLAGPGQKVGSAIVYDERRLADLLARPRCTDQTLDAVRPVIVRLGRERKLNLSQTWAEQAEVVRRNWYVPPLLGLMLDRWGCLDGRRFPLVATIASWVVFGAEVTGHTYDRGAPPAANRSAPPRTFHVEPAGDWFAPIEETWLPLEHGPTVTVWGAPVNGPLREVDWLSVDAEKQKERVEYEMWLRSAPVLRDVAQVGLTSADAILWAWNETAPPRPETGRGGAAMVVEPVETTEKNQAEGAGKVGYSTPEIDCTVRTTWQE
ncbi:hypothetical protein SAMN05428985_102435 [Nocardioides sp. YR527]|uniref:hypothetical protein n=1 Tax=Nocardioides sp. YR527 TaxID=1881028 RepID=UPI00088B8AF7|nr:hypothetical protein [Nocardioides sp. YR527]SDK04847.1 hypothetical protein SAMN05428985_102435 [Nocardioides sp. YR527]